MSLEQMLHLPHLPEEFDMREYFEAMHAYVDALAQKHNIYHHDLSTPGNLMFDPASRSPFVVDFGRSFSAYPDQDGFFEFRLGHQMIRTRDYSHEELRGVEQKLRERFY